MKKLLPLVLVLVFSVASAKTYSITLYQPSLVAGTELKPGQYLLALQDGKVVIKSDKLKVETPVKVENAESKFSTTSIRYASAEGKARIQEIRLGGTSLRLLFE